VLNFVQVFLAVRSGFDKKTLKVIFKLWILNAISVQVTRTGMNLVNMLTYITIVTIITIALYRYLNACQTLALYIAMHFLHSSIFTSIVWVSLPENAQEHLP
jgi:uncharacterized membrane protein HdeD (DUF308 family)